MAAPRRQIRNVSVVTAWLLCGAVAVAQPKPAAEPKPAPADPTPAAPKADATEPPEPSQQTAAPAESSSYEDADPRALTDFKPYLDPNGAWVEDPVYGLVWIPHVEVVGENFSPYVTDGHWALTAAGDWIWVSDYPFGWVVFHYGRWVWSESYGWVWIPGRKYAHAWVVWRVPVSSYDYVGWAPAPPSYVWWGGAAFSLWWYSPPVTYVFVPSYYVFSPRVYRYVVMDPRRVHSIARYTAPYRVPATARPRGPSLERAHVPAEAMPQSRAIADPRALSAARRDPAVRYSPPKIQRAPVYSRAERRMLPPPAVRPTAPAVVAPRRAPAIVRERPSREVPERAPVLRPGTRRYTPPSRPPSPAVRPAPPVVAPPSLPTRTPAKPPSRTR